MATPKYIYDSQYRMPGDTAYANAFNQGKVANGMYEFTPEQIAGMNDAGNAMIPDAAKANAGGMTGYQMGSLGLQGANAVIGWKQLGLAQDAFDFNKKKAEADYAANATQVNNMVNSSNNINRNVTNKVNAMQAANGGLASAVYHDKQTVAKTL